MRSPDSIELMFSTDMDLGEVGEVFEGMRAECTYP